MAAKEMKSAPVEVAMQRMRRQRRQRFATRMTLVVVVSLLLVVCLAFSAVWLYRVFYRDNPHFLFRELEMKDTVHFNKKTVQELLEGNQEYPCLVGRTSLLNLDLGKIRAVLQKEPLVKEVLVRRIMPGTIEIDIQEREAIAILSSGQNVVALVDEGGTLFPYTGNEGLNLPLPFIVYGAGVETLPKGVAIDDAGVCSAVALINEISARAKIDGAAYAANVIKINPERERLEVMLRPLYGNRVFPANGALVWIPLDKGKMLEALARLEAILVRKVSESETLSFADVTLQFNVPTRD